MFMPKNGKAGLISAVKPFYDISNLTANVLRSKRFA